MCLGEVTKIVELTEELEVYKVFRYEEAIPFGVGGLFCMCRGSGYVVPMHLWVDEVCWRECYDWGTIRMRPGGEYYNTGWHCFIDLDDAREVIRNLQANGYRYVVARALVKGRVIFGVDGSGGCFPGARVVVSKLMNVLEIVGDGDVSMDVIDGSIQASEGMGRREAVVV
jgi:hypothetical protein